MPMQEPTRPTTCDRCGKPYNTSDQHPRRYCSIACEEGRSPLPKSDPASDGYHLHVQSNPESLVGRTLVATALKRTCYAPEWHKSPSDYKQSEIVEHTESEKVIVYETIVVIGTVADYADGQYQVEHENIESGELTYRSVDDSLAVEQLRTGRWWAE